MYISFKFSNCCYKSTELLGYLIINDAVFKKNIRCFTIDIINCYICIRHRNFSSRISFYNCKLFFLWLFTFSIRSCKSRSCKMEKFILVGVLQRSWTRCNHPIYRFEREKAPRTGGIRGSRSRGDTFDKFRWKFWDAGSWLSLELD